MESFPLVFVERFAEPDRRLTALCRRLAEQVGWPLQSPLVGAFSNQYYWAFPAFNLVCLPAGEETTCLGWADLCHELGHILLMAHRATLVSDFVRDLTDYIREEQRRVVSGQRPPEYQRLYAPLLAQWQDQWLGEFVSDMVAAYLVGPSFGWQHVRLCSGHSRESYFPALGEAAEHPADEARFRAISATLALIGATEAAARVGELWQRYLSAAGEQPPADYELCYPQPLIEGLARRVVDGCRSLGLRPFGAGADPALDVPALLAEAWGQLFLDPDGFARWERLQLEALWRDLGFSR